MCEERGRGRDEGREKGDKRRKGRGAEEEGVDIDGGGGNVGRAQI